MNHNPKTDLDGKLYEKDVLKKINLKKKSNRNCNHFVFKPLRSFVSIKLLMQMSLLYLIWKISSKSVVNRMLIML